MNGKWRRTSNIFLLLLLIIPLSIQQDDQPIISNEVLGEPTVSCAADAIYVKFRTRSTFLGHVDVKYTPDKNCYHSLVTNNQIEVLIPHQECMIQRRRSFHPSGVILEISISVAFHPEFTTIDDTVFSLQCFHQKKHNETISSSLSIGSPEPPPIDTKGPSCNYQVLNSPGGQPAKRLTLGESVYHSWQCENVYESCIIVENCELVGGENRHEVIDAHGCSKHESIMPQLKYFNNTSVGALVQVFGVSDTTIVYFSCQIRLHPQLPSGQCPTPKCEQLNRLKRQSSHLPSIDVRSQNVEISQLVNATQSTINTKESVEEATCPPIHVEEMIPQSPSEGSGLEGNDDRICADYRSVIVLTLLLTLCCILVTSLVVFLVVRRQKYEIASMS